MAVYSHYKLGETLQAKEWAGVALAVIRTIGIGWNSEEQQPAELSGFRYLIGAFLVAVVAAPGPVAPPRPYNGSSTAAARRLSGWSAWDRPTT